MSLGQNDNYLILEFAKLREQIELKDKQIKILSEKVEELEITISKRFLLPAQADYINMKIDYYKNGDTSRLMESWEMFVETHQNKKPV